MQPLEKAAKAQDKRLAALEVVKAGKEAQKYLDAKDNIVIVLLEFIIQAEEKLYHLY